MSRSRRRKLMRELARKHRTILRTGIPVASALLVAMPAAYAQQAPATAGAGAPAGGLEEVVVTAQKRVENLQDVPISVQVLDTAKLDQLNIGNIDDYVKFAPGIAYVRGEGQGGNGEPGESHIYIRGIASGGTNHSGSQPSVGEYLDEQPVTTIDGNVDIHIYDIQRIEVLEGPQGTLYGASSQSGTVRIITNKPDPTKFSAGVDVQGNQILTHGGGYEVEGFVNIPITSNMAVRLVGWGEHDGGYISNVAGTNANACIFNGVRTFGAWSGQAEVSAYQANGSVIPNNYPCTPVSSAPLGAGSINNAAYVKNDYNPVNTKGGRGALRWNLGDWTITPTFMAQNVTTEGFFAYDPGVGDLQLAHFSPENSSDSWYQSALTVEGKLSNLDLVYSGGFFKRDTHSLADYSDYSVFYDRVYGSGIYWNGNSGNHIMPQELVNSRHDYEKWSHELRVSTPVQLPVKGTFGVFVQRQLHNIFEQYTMPGYGFVNPYGSPLNPAGLTDAYSIPTLFQSIWLTDETRVDRDQAASAQANIGPYTTDYLKNYEIGWKTQFFDRHLRWNGAAFWEDWNNFQFSFLGVNSVTIIKNGPDARLTGLESNIDWVPTQNLVTSLNFQWINAHVTQKVCSQGPPCADQYGVPTVHTLPGGSTVNSYLWASNGTKLPITPNFKGSLVVRYNLPQIGGWEPFAQGDWTYQASSSVQLR